MIWTLARKELLSNLLTLRLGITFLFAVGLIALTSIIGSMDFSQRAADYDDRVRDVRHDLEKATVFAEVGPHVVARPDPLSIFSRGVDRNGGQFVWIGIDWVGASMGRLGSADNNLMKSLVEIDFVAVVMLLLSFLAVVLGFDAVCGERESGTLRQLLTNPVPRGAVIWAKLLGGTISLCLPLIVAFGLAVLIITVNPDVDLGSMEWLRLGLLLLLSCLFLAQVFAMSLVVSTHTRSPSTSLVICLFGWLFLNIGFDSALPSLSRYGVQENTFQQFLDELRAERDEAIAQWEANNPPPPDRYMRAIEVGGPRIRYGHPRGYEWRARRNAYALEQHLDSARRGHQFQMVNYAPLAREVEPVDEWAILSHFTNSRALSKQLARSTLAHKFRLRQAGHDYRDTYIDYLRGHGAFASRRWFTDDPVDQEPLLTDPESLTPEMLASDSPFMQARMAWVQDQETLAAADSRRQLDLTSMPRFGVDWREPLSQTLRHMTPGLIVLFLLLGGSTLLAIHGFLRYDPQ